MTNPPRVDPDVRLAEQLRELLEDGESRFFGNDFEGAERPIKYATDLGHEIRMG